MARNESDALAEARAAVHEVVKATLKPIELLPRAPQVAEKQAAMLQSDFPEHPLERLGSGLQTRIRILPSHSWQMNQEQKPDPSLRNASEFNLL